MAVSEDPQRSASYWDLIAFIVSNAVAGEMMAVDNYTDMASILPAGSERDETLRQAEDEAKHRRMLAGLGRRRAFPVIEQIVEPPWHRIRGHFQTAAKRQDLAACLIVQDLMVESMAIVLYRLLAGRADTDDETQSVAQPILDDELAHLAIGVQRLQRLLDADSVAVEDALIWAHHRVMPEMLSMVSTSCDSLCDVLGVACDSLSLADIQSDVASIRADALERYVQSLDEVGLAPAVVNPLVASLAGYEQDLRIQTGMSGDCC